MTNTLDDVQNAGARCTSNVISGFVFSGLMALMLLVFDWRLGAVVIATIALFLLINSAMQRSAHALSASAWPRRAPSWARCWNTCRAWAWCARSR